MNVKLYKNAIKSDFLNDKGIIDIFNAIKTAEGNARFVGGCVRDAFAQKEINDIDISTDLIPENVISVLNKAGIKTFPSGIKHGTVTAVIDEYSKDKKIIIGKRNIEITTLRKDIENNGRHAKVKFTKSWKDDALRRDFTFNALYADLQGNVYDYFNGIKDLKNGRIKFIGNAEKRIEEDYLRILRFFRFIGYFDECEIDDEAIEACSKKALKLKELSNERIRDEIFKILGYSSPASVFELMKEEEILSIILPEATEFNTLRMLCWIENMGIKLPNVMPSPIRRLAALIGFGRDNAQSVSKKLVLSKKQTNHLSSILSRTMDPYRNMDEEMINIFLHLYGANQFKDLILLKWAEEKTIYNKSDPEEIEQWYDLLEKCEHWLPLEFPIKGQDILDLGIEKGPKIGEILSKAENWWQENKFEPSKDEIIDYIKAKIL